VDKKLQLAWVDLTLSESTLETTEIFEAFFAIKRINAQKLADTNCPIIHPDAFIFEYDFPDREGLKLLLETKHQFSSTPIIMLTEQHSEELAIWALHARTWDYIIKPIKTEQIRILKNELLKLELLKDPTKSKRYLFERELHTPTEAKISPADQSEEIIQRAINYISAHINEKISESHLANLCSMSPYRFSRLFKEYCSCTFQEYLVQQRIDEAVRLLANPDTPISDIAFTVGFNDASYFTRAFRRYVGMSPTEFRAHKNQQLQSDN